MSAAPLYAQKLSDYKLPEITADTLVANHLDNLRRIKNTGVPGESFLVQMYGQSIVASLENKSLQEFFDDLLPKQEVQVINNGIGGFRAPTLIRTASSDLYPHYPDLLVFHVYGGIKDGVLNEFFKEIRLRLGSDVLIFDHHYSFVNDEGGQRRLNEGESKKSNIMKSLAIENGFGFIEVRKYWKEFLDLNPELVITDLLKDRVHPNDLGKDLLHFIIKQSIRKGLSIQSTSPIKKVQYIDTAFIDIQSSKQLKLSFEGNRIDAIIPAGIKKSDFQIFIDDKRALKSNLFYVTRLGRFPGQWYPAISSIGLDDNIEYLEEEWTLNFYDIDYDKSTYKLDLTGSKTGTDGSGASGSDFKSNSGRISFIPSDVRFLPPSKRMIDEKVYQQEIKFETLPLFMDPMRVDKSGQYTIVKGLPNTKHTITIVSQKPQNFDDWKFKVYQPLKRASD
ncbi:hypothetical protein EJ995_02290 [Nonlabens ponticola]|uniref:SGNH/GDSL hydrolase family protein n=1 Tax=Nonlabens ponticola TaxID=2496866 RepID=A0A3S9MVB9_9FLAO|nr:hypothetical protein EJ995_02290 [Nonlabens ponticola]